MKYKDSIKKSASPKIPPKNNKVPTSTTKLSSKKPKSAKNPTRFIRRLRLLHWIRHLPAPYIAKVVEFIKPGVPLHIGIALNSSYYSEWIESTFNGYDKMHRTSTLSCPFLRSKLPPNLIILSPRPSFEIRTTDLDFFYELKVILCANGFKIFERVCFENSYYPACNGPSFCQSVCITATLCLPLFA